MQGWTARQWGVAMALGAAALLLAVGPGWLGGARQGDKLARRVLSAAAIAQSLAFAKSSPPRYVTCAGGECETLLQVELPPGVYLWMEGDGDAFVARALHAASDTVWVSDGRAGAARPEPASAAQRAARDTFLGQRRAAPAPEIGELATTLGNGTVHERVRAADALRRLGPAAAPAVPILIENLGPGRGSLQPVHIAAINALLAIGPRATIEPLIAALQHERREVAAGAAFTLGGFGAAARPAVPALLQALRDPDVRDAADAALREIEAEG